MFLPLPKDKLVGDMVIITFINLDLPDKGLSRMFRKYNNLYASARSTIEHHPPHMLFENGTKVEGEKYINETGQLEYRFPRPEEGVPFNLIYGDVSYVY